MLFASAKVESPAFVAVIEQVPGAIGVSVVPETVQILSELEVKLIAPLPEPPDAANCNVVPTVSAGNGKLSADWVCPASVLPSGNIPLPCPLRGQIKVVPE